MLGEHIQGATTYESAHGVKSEGTCRVIVWGKKSKTRAKSRDESVSGKTRLRCLFLRRTKTKERRTGGSADSGWPSCRGGEENKRRTKDTGTVTQKNMEPGLASLKKNKKLTKCIKHGQ